MIEIRNAGIDKEKAALYFLSKADYDFVLAIGDDRTDEDFSEVCRLQLGR